MNDAKRRAMRAAWRDREIPRRISGASYGANRGGGFPEAPSPGDQALDRGRNRRGRRAISMSIGWHPEPMQKPTVDSEFRDMPALTRAAESIRYNVASLFYFLSPGGGLVQWLKLCALLAIVGSLFVFAVKPLVILVGQFEKIMAGLPDFLGNILFSVAMCLLLYGVLKHFPKILRFIGGLFGDR